MMISPSAIPDPLAAALTPFRSFVGLLCLGATSYDSGTTLDQEESEYVRLTRRK